MSNYYYYYFLIKVLYIHTEGNCVKNRAYLKYTLNSFTSQVFFTKSFGSVHLEDMRNTSYMFGFY